MRSELSAFSETKPLLDDFRKKNEEKSSTVSRPKLLWGLLSLFVVAVVVIAIMFNKNHATKGKKFVFTDTWSILETIDTKYISKQWSYSSLCDDSDQIKLTFAVKQQNIDLIEEKLLEVSDPASPKFGQHWSAKEIHEFLKPKDESLEILLDWFNYYNIDEDSIEYLSSNKDFIRVTTTIEVANEMLHTEYAYWTNKDGNKKMRVKDKYYVPTTIAEHLDFVLPTLRFPPRRHTKSINKLGTDPSAISQDSITYNTPERIRSLYQMNDYINSAAYPDHYQAIAEFEGEWFTNSDIESFWSYFDVKNVSLVRVPSSQPSGYGDESELDIEYITSTGSGIRTYAWDVEDDIYFATLAEEILESSTPPSVVSISYGGDEQSNGYSFCQRANIEFAKLGLYGVTALASSGDSGVTGDSDQCTDEYYPSFPASSPYVVAVGGTTGGTIQASVTDFTDEVAWVDSGGGFSWFFDRQKWQNDAVDTYYDTVSKLPNTTKFNYNGRGYPDLSAQSVDFIICWESSYWSVSGTSCSSPSVGGMIALINDIRLQNNKTRLGWLLPSLYGIMDDSSSYFNDIVEGYNEGCAEDDYVGFLTNEKWDPVTGWGTPKFSLLLKALYDL
jgi:tripeptidyl-peptidase-1